MSEVTVTGEAASVRRHLETERFEDMGTQTHASQFGMWVFIVSEVLLFSALFTLYSAYRAEHPEAFAAGVRLMALVLGTVNTFVLLTASFLVAVAVHAIRRDRFRWAAVLLAGAAALGVVFLFLKGIEYAEHFRDGLDPGLYFTAIGPFDPALKLFFALYYVMTGLHALHVLGGVGVLSWLAWRARQGAYDRWYHTPLELGGMYWHFVDIVWLFLWPAFYLLR
jgi:cytochrome c oxidase subunit 3